MISKFFHFLFISLLVFIFPLYSIELSRNPRWIITQAEIARVSHTAISPDNKLVALAGKLSFHEADSVVIQIRNLDSGQLIATIDKLGTSLVALGNLKFSQDGEFLYAIVGDKIQFWTSSDWKLAQEIKVDGALGIDLSSDNKSLAVTNIVNAKKNSVTYVSIYNRQTGNVEKEILNIPTKKLVVSHLVLSQDASILYGSVENSRIGVIAWDVKRGRELYFASQKAYGDNFGINEKYNLLVTSEASSDRLHLFDLKTGMLKQSFPIATSNITGLSIHPDGQNIIISRRIPKEFIQILNLKTKKVSKFSGQMQVFRSDLSNDGSILSLAAFFTFQLPQNLSFAVYDVGNNSELSQLSSSYGADDFKLGHEVEVNLSGKWTKGFVAQISSKTDQILVEFPNGIPKDKIWTISSSLRFINVEDRKIDPLDQWKIGDRVNVNIKGQTNSGLIENIKKDTGWILIRFDSSKPKAPSWVRPWNLVSQ
ncbi:MAG: hypothetical protein GW761_18170 [Leptospira sp.]|nr:hypothetical protein [Leptospira sp.]